MFIGHYAVALGAKRASPDTSLGTLIAAAATLDLIWPVLILAGFERVTISPGATAVTPLDFEYYPWSHSLLMSIVWGAVFGGVYYLWRRSQRGAVVVGLLVVSHWVLDAVAHRPDLPLVPGADTRVGLGLWNSVAGTLTVELTLFVIGLAIYLRTTRASDGVGRWGFGALMAFILLIYVGSLSGPPPPNTAAIAWTDMGQWLIVAWAAWTDRHRSRNLVM